MSFGFTGVILHVDLGSKKIEKRRYNEEFYRTYMGGSAIGSFFLLKETGPDTDPLSEDNIITIAPGVTTGALVSGVSRCCVTALSPLTGTAGDGQSGGSIGPMIKRAGYDAIVIKGRADKLSYLLVRGDDVKIEDASSLKERIVSEVYDEIIKKHGVKNISVLQCGPAGERKVAYANLLADLNNVVGRSGLGAVFGSKNLRAVVVCGENEVGFSNPGGLKELSKKGAKRIPECDFPSVLKKFGTPGVVGSQAEAGNFSTHNYSRGFHEGYQKLNGENFESAIGAGSKTCMGCAVACRKKVKSEKPYKVSDKMGGPEFETLGLLGANLDIMDPVAVAKANELCNEYGLDTIQTGAIAGYLFECIENGLIGPDIFGGKAMEFGDPESLFWIIENVSNRKGIGDTIAGGFNTLIEKFGRETGPYAIHVKGKGLAAHMPQVKPGMALMYAVCPIGPDHMSSEHDWLLASGSEESKGLGILGRESAQSTSIAKVRMTVYSQYYYSLLDALSLCMFCWGPGSLFTYRDIEDLLLFATGWEVTFWELMKVGERRTNMMRQINAKRGYTRDHDVLPERLFKPFQDGPSKGAHVDKDAFNKMLDKYYAFMGWDATTGNPTSGKLEELGLDWAL